VTATDLTPRDRWAIETMSRQIEVLDTYEAEARRLADPPARCAAWLALRRQVPGYERYLRPWISGVGFDGAVPAIAEHRQALASRLARAETEVARFDEATQGWARRRVGLRLAVIGKGGAGKTVLASTLARFLARRGRRVLAVDLDTNPGLAMSLGMAPTEAGLPAEAIEQDEGANYGWQLAGGVTPAEVVERFSSQGPDGVRFLGVGKIDSPFKLASKQSVPAIVQVLLGLGSPDLDVVADLEAGPTTPFERYHAFADDAMVVVGPAWRSAMTARRLLPMVSDVDAMIVASQYRDEPDHPGLRPWARIPFDPAVRQAERRGLSPVDACPDAPAMRAIDRLARALLAPGRHELAAAEPDLEARA
jgi:CO dehydrogenase maturation factor